MRTYNLNRKYIKDLQQKADRNDGSINPKIKGRITRVNLKTQFGKTIINNPEEYFTEEVMKQLDDAAEKEFRYGNIHSEV